MKVVIFEKDIQLLAKLERFFRSHKINAYPIFEISELHRIENAILICDHKLKESLNQQTWEFYIYFQLQNTMAHIHSNEKPIEIPCRLTFLKIQKILELFFIESGFEVIVDNFSQIPPYPLAPQQHLAHSLAKPKIQNHFIYDHLPKTLYKILQNLFESPDGISKDELEQKSFSTKFNTPNHIYVQVHNLRKALATIPNNNYLIQYKDKKYKLISIN